MDARYEKLKETSHGRLRPEAEARTSAIGKDRTRDGTFSRIDAAGAISPMAPSVDLVLPPENADRPPVELPHRFPPGGRPVPPPVRHSRVRALTMGGKAKHSRPSLWERLTRRRPRLALRPPRTVRTGGPAHRHHTPVDRDAAAAGRVRGGRYITLCGAEVIAAGMTEPGREGTATTTPQATDDVFAHLGIDHGGALAESSAR
jgi:hypothetical protein